MFLDSLERTNPAFVAATIELHQAGQLPANSYVVDLDAVASNAQHILGAAHQHGLTVYPMTKQFGRNPTVMATISATEAHGFVAVDMACARAIRHAGFALGHLGHLVQVPQHEVAEGLAMCPHYWTVFSLAQAQAISRNAHPAQPQKILLRVYGDGDVVVPSHAGGFAVAAIDAALDAIGALPGLSIAGVTTYPFAAFDRLTRQVRPTPNVTSMQRVATKLRARGITDAQINMASELSAGTIALAAEGGATQIEPGHAFTGTSPYQIFTNTPERQAMLYLSEISHMHGAGAFCYGGGLYECIGAVEHTPQALVGRHGQSTERALLTAPPPGVIDFYGRLDFATGSHAQVGDSVITCTRPQAFFTRAFGVPVQGIQTGTPRVLGIFDVTGFMAQGTPEHLAGLNGR